MIARLLTSGTMSVRIDRLEAEGLVNRRVDPSSARNTLISLTGRGRGLVEAVVPAHLRNARRLLSALSGEELEALAGLLRKLLVEFEGSAPPVDASVRLGLTLAPVHSPPSCARRSGCPRRSVCWCAPCAVTGRPSAPGCAPATSCCLPGAASCAPSPTSTPPSTTGEHRL